MSDRYQKAVYCAAQFATSFPLIEEFLREARKRSTMPSEKIW